ncbi:MAG: ATP-binding protein [Desulfurococcales archaeon]|nr:ATP-binding protein [Desulfurococcales archaeon]
MLKPLLKRRNSTSRRDACVCGTAELRVEGLSKSISDMDVQEIKHFVKAFLAALNIGFPIEFRTLIHPQNLDKYINKLEKDLSTLKIILEESPTPSAKRRFRELQKALHMINNEGITPLRFESLIRITSCGDDSDALIDTLKNRGRLLKEALNSLGIRVEGPKLRLDKRKGNGLHLRLLKSFNSILRKSVVYASPPSYAQIFLFPFILYRKDSQFGAGMPIGRDPFTKELIWWDPGSSTSPHIIVLGPTGSGKTTFLANTVIHFKKFIAGNVLILDIKGEYPTLLKGEGLPLKELVVGRNAGINLCRLSAGYPESWGSVALTEIISKSLSIDKDVESLLYESLDYGLRYGCPDLIGAAEDYISSHGSSYLTYRVKAVLNKIKGVSKGVDLVEEIERFVAGDREDVLILNLSGLASFEEDLTHLVVEAVARSILRVISGFSGRASGRWGLMVMDEGWMYLRKLRETLVTLLRLGRSYKIAVAFATQSPDDLSILGTAVTSSGGVLVAMSSSDPLYWRIIKSFMRLTEDECSKYPSILNVGEGIIRLSTDGKGRPFSVLRKLQPFKDLPTN